MNTGEGDYLRKGPAGGFGMLATFYFAFILGEDGLNIVF